VYDACSISAICENVKRFYYTSEVYVARKKRAARSNWPFSEGKALALEQFSTGEVAEILGIPMWRLQKFLSSPAYRLSVFDQIGEGKGSRRLFIREALYRIATALVLVRDGFAPSFVGSALKHIDEDTFDERAENGRPFIPGIQFQRTTREPKIAFFESGRTPEMRAQRQGVYYALDLSWVMDEVNKRIHERKQPGKQQKEQSQ
jgi:hypothetical protein